MSGTCSTYCLVDYLSLLVTSGRVLQIIFHYFIDILFFKVSYFKKLMICWLRWTTSILRSEPVVVISPLCLMTRRVLRFRVLFCDLRLLFRKFGLAGCVEEKGNGVDDWVRLCRKIRLFYDLNAGKNTWELIRGNNSVGVGVVVKHGGEELIQEYFCRLGAKKEDVARLIVNRPKLLDFDLKMGMVNVLKLLKHFASYILV